MIGIKFALALGLLATASAFPWESEEDPFFKSETLETYPQGFEKRRISSNYLRYCTHHEYFKVGIAASDEVMRAYANRGNNMNRNISLSVASFTAFYTNAGSGIYCKFTPETPSENGLTGPLVIVRRGIDLQYYAKKAEDNDLKTVYDANKEMEAALRKMGGEFDTGSNYAMMIVETTAENEIYVGIPILDRSEKTYLYFEIQEATTKKFYPCSWKPGHM